MRTLAISTLVKRFLCAVGTSLYGQKSLCSLEHFTFLKSVLITSTHIKQTHSMTYIILILILDFLFGILKLGPNSAKVDTKSLSSLSKHTNVK